MLQPNSTASFITISFKQTLAESPVQYSISAFGIFLRIKQSKKVCTLLSIVENKNKSSFAYTVTRERVEIFQKIKRF